jgi:hypothetical protein
MFPVWTIFCRLKKEKRRDMKKLTYLFAIVTVWSCSEPIEYPYEYISSKTEKLDNNKINAMHLYAYSGELNTDTLKMFLQDRIMEDGAEYFWSFIVLFDDKENAKFPKDPFLASYGLEEDKSKHIRAIYTFNSLNVYSGVTVYEKNKWESVPKDYPVSVLK